MLMLILRHIEIRGKLILLTEDIKNSSLCTVLGDRYFHTNCIGREKRLREQKAFNATDTLTLRVWQQNTIQNQTGLPGCIEFL